MWDNELTFSNGQPLADASSHNIVDTGPDDIGNGEPVYLQVVLGEGATGALTVTLDAGDAADMSGASQRVSYLVDAARVARGGVVLAAALPTGCGRYKQLRYSGASGGKVTAGLVQGAQSVPSLR